MKPGRIVKTTKSPTQKRNLMTTRIKRVISEDTTEVALIILSDQGTADSVVATTISAVVATEALLNQEEVQKTKATKSTSHLFVTTTRAISESSLKIAVRLLTSF